MKRWIVMVLAILLILSGCSRYEPPEELPETLSGGETVQSGKEETKLEDALLQKEEQQPPERQRVKVKGIYVSAYVAGTGNMLDQIIEQIDATELNAVVIDVKDDQGRVTFAMDSPWVKEIGASKTYIRDMPDMIRKLEEHNIYPIARIVAFRDPYLAEQKPEWSLHTSNGEIYRDSQGLAWVNPYRQEVWDYLVDIGKKAGEIGFREIQFDYVRFAVDRTMKDVVYDESDTRGRTRTQAISQFISYAYEKLSAEGLMVSADVFGTIIGSSEDTQSLGQDYGEMSQMLDYICPMIYPSHYGDGNFGLEHPDMQPYETVFNALQGSRKVLERAAETETQTTEGGYSSSGNEASQGEEQEKPEKEPVIVRPWLQDFTASYLENHIPYGDEQVRQQIQAVYDAGYDEWLLWDAGVSYHFGGLRTPQEAALEERQIQESREALQNETEGEPQVQESGGHS